MKNFFKSKKFYIGSLVLLIYVMVNFFVNQTHAELLSDVLIDRGNVSEQVLYLSDITYKKAQVGWGNISFDKTQSNTSLILRFNNSSTVFNKGIWAHATSTVEYDISEYKDYAYFSTYYGLNTTAGATGNGVKFYVYTSKDGSSWDLRSPENPDPLKGVDNALYLKIDIRDANYIRLYAHDNGANASDHAVWADAKLVKEGYSDNAMIPVEDFDAYIKSRYTSGAIKDDLKLILLQRTFIRNVGQYQLREFLDSDPKNKEVVEWLLYNEEVLRLWTIGGKPNGTYARSLQVLSDLYHTYKDDLTNENLTSLGNKYKDIYLKMMLSLSLTHSTNVGLWIGGNQFSSAVVRYQIYKDMHMNGQLDTAMFESYTVDEMRGVMITNIDDEEILWLHDYSKKFSTAADRFNPYKYIRYTLSYSYYRPQYYTQENYAKWDQKYNLSKYNITYKSGKPKLWIVFEEGAVCGGLSKTAANLYGVWGYPARVVGQPGHAAYVYLYNAGGGKFAWQLANSAAATGWADTGGSATNGWGTRYATNSGGIQSGSYLLLAQEAQNEYDKYERSQLIMLLEDVYKNDKKKLERIYRDALEEEIINLDAWIGLVNLYITDDSKSDEDLVELATEIAEVYTYHPLPMYDLTRRIASKISSPGYKSRLIMLQDETLRKATKATSKDTIYYKEVPVIANAILGVYDSKVATFSFDGNNAGKIALSRQLQSAQVAWKYSIDGGNTWKDVFEHSVQLTKEEIESISPEKDIKIHITGLPMTDANIYTIDILKGVFPSGVVSIDDLENKVKGANSTMEWSLDPNGGEWNSFADTNPTFRGDVRVYIRKLATGVYTITDPVYFTFTKNVSSDTNRYIPRAGLKVVSVSGTSAGNMNNILDGNLNTAWHGPKANFMTGGTYKASHVIIELDKPRYVSEVDYQPNPSALANGKYPAGKAKSLEIYVSMDGVNWELAGKNTNLANNSNLKKITLDEAKQAKYVKINCPVVWEHGLEAYFSISIINLYENPSASEVPTAEVSYNIVNATNKDVVAELVDENRPITVTNNGGSKTYTFRENGTFTFEFVDGEGRQGSATATVDWIDKRVPNINVTYNTTELTNEEVVATISFDKEVTILSTNVPIVENPVDKSKTITFLENASYIIEVVDSVGNIGIHNVAVDWIDKTSPTAEIEYSTKTITDGVVTATLNPSEEVTITNNGGIPTYTFNENGSFTFEFVDKAGNEGTALAMVTWITKVPQYDINYSTKELTNKDVTVVLNLENGYTLVNNDGNNTYTFTDNGTFEFEYIDANSNLGKIPVTVDWIDKTPPTAELKYDIQEDKVIVTIINPSEEITFADGNGVYEFTKNGTYELIIYDKIGNRGVLLVKIDSFKDPSEVIPDPEPNPNPEPNPDPVDPKPEEPTNPTNPVVTTTKPVTNNEKTTKPVVNNSTKPVNTTKPNSNEIVTTKKPTTEDKDDLNYKKYSSNCVELEIPSKIVDDNTSLVTGSFEVTNELKDKLGNASEYFDLYIADENSKKVLLPIDYAFKISIKLNSNKEFVNVYEVIDGELEAVEYEKANGKILIKSNRLGKYVVSYNKNENTVTKDDKTESNQKTFVILGIAALTILLFGAVVYFIKFKK